jgi:hypothetical protein
MSWAVTAEPGNAGNISALSIPSSGPLIMSGDLILTQPGTGIIVVSPTGMSVWRLLVSNAGNLARQSVSNALLLPMGQWIVQQELSGIGNDWSNETLNGPLFNVLLGDLVLTSAGAGVILYTPNAQGPYRILAANDGAPSAQPSPSPITPAVAWGNDFVIGKAGAGIVCSTPNGLHSYRIGVDDSGAIFGQQVS